MKNRRRQPHRCIKDRIPSVKQLLSDRQSLESDLPIENLLLPKSDNQRRADC